MGHFRLLLRVSCGNIGREIISVANLDATGKSSRRVIQKCVGLLQMQRNRVVNSGADTLGIQEARSSHRDYLCAPHKGGTRRATRMAHMEGLVLDT